MLLGEPLPEHVYLDTSIVLACILAGDPQSHLATAFCSDIAQHGAHVYFSHILWLEVANVFKKCATVPGKLAPDLHRSYGLDRWEHDFMVRQRWMAFCEQQLAAFVRQFDTAVELPFRRRTWERSVGIMAYYRLDSHDAIHVATAQEYGLVDFAALDGHFRRVEELELWPKGA